MGILVIDRMTAIANPMASKVCGISHTNKNDTIKKANVADVFTLLTKSDARNAENSGFTE